MKMKSAVFALVAAFAFSACSDDDGAYTCSSCVDSPEANASYNATGQGVYKGILVGSSGTITFYIANEGTTIKAVLEIDNMRIELTATGSYSTDTGFTGAFTGTLNGSPVSISFAVNNSGSFEVYNIVIPGHDDVEIHLIKELSDKLVVGFEGTFSGEPGGTFNLVARLNENGSGIWYAISRTNITEQVPQPVTSFFSGEITEAGIVIGGGGDVDVDGEISGDNISGTWDNGDVSGTWKGRRTL